MSKLGFVIVFLVTNFYGIAQYNEFGENGNGLMYDDSTMKQLKFVVDTLNIKFRNCGLNKTFYSKYQAIAHYVELDTGDIKSAKKDMLSDILFDEFVKKFPDCVIDSFQLVVKFEYVNYRDKAVIEFSSIPADGGYGHKVDFMDEPTSFLYNLKNTWQFSYNEKDNYSDESIRGFYFVSDFQKDTIPEVYARMVQYSECMVDTNTQIFLENVHESGIRVNEESGTKVKAFFEYINEYTQKPPKAGLFRKRYYKKLQEWERQKYLAIKNELSIRGQFKVLLEEAYKDAILNGGSSDELELLVANYYSKNAALELKRSRRVIGGCSRDQRPRYHARDIAILSAETVNWEVFLRAHLNIMNDRFDRVSDGSYAWAGRQTYIRELEELEINVADLLLGISFRVENPSKNHYYGSIRRLGRALTETKYAEEIEAKMLAIISDSNLDSYNRMLIYYLFVNYNYYLKDKDRAKTNKVRLKTAVKTLPAYLSSRMELGE